MKQKINFSKIYNKIPVPKSLILLFALAIILIGLRVYLYDRYSLVYLIWNIFLAAIPYLISSVLLYFSNKKRLNKTLFIISGIVWLLFLPNAPYIITDLIHIGVVHGVPVLYDSILLFTSAWLGLLLGLYSILQIEEILLNKYSKIITNRLIIGILFLASFGMHLGRTFRFNSWDIFTSPILFFGRIFNIFSLRVHHEEALSYTLLFFAFLVVSYWSFKLSKKND